MLYYRVNKENRNKQFGTKKSIMYYVSTQHRESSIGIDVEDKFIQETEKQVDGINIQIKEYLIEESQVHKWTIDFMYNDAQYSIMMIGIDKEKVEEIIENLYFS